MEFQPKAMHTRLLYPFYFMAGKLDAAAEGLKSLSQLSRQGLTQVWEDIKSPKDAYRQEALSHVSNYLFPKADSSAHCCHYLRVADSRLNSWFGRAVEVHEPDRTGDQSNNHFFAGMICDPGIEVFLSPYGVGILSIAFQTDYASWRDIVPVSDKHPDQQNGDILTQFMRFNYRLSQLSRKGTVPVLCLPASDYARPSATSDAPLEQRLGKAGARFTLGELVAYLLAPVEAAQLSFSPAQSQFSVYSVVRFDCETDFATERACTALGPFLTALAQIEEPSHAGSVSGSTLSIPDAIMNRRHWAAVSFLGAAHLVADQPPPHAFNEQRVSTIRDKYFIPFLVAFLQRLTLNRAISQGAELLRSSKEKSDAGFHALHNDLLEFLLCAYFTEVSSREALNRFYRIAQQGLGVQAAKETITRAISEYDAIKISDVVSSNVRAVNANAEATKEAVETVAEIQKKIEWLEVFIASAYAAEVSHIVAPMYFSEDFAHFSVLLWTVVAAFLAWLGLHGRLRMLSLVIFTTIVVLMAGWTFTGYNYFLKH